MGIPFSGKIRAGIRRIFYKVRHSVRKRWAYIQTLWFVLRSRGGVPGVLFVSRSFLAHGGVETRVRKYSSVWKKRGYRVYIASVWEDCSGGDVSFFLTRNISFNNWLLRYIIYKQNIRIVEWQAGGPEPPLFSLSLLRLSGVRAGVIIHAARKEWNFNYVQHAEYVACSSRIQTQRAPLLAGACVLPNAVDYRSSVWQYAGQQKSVIISRISQDKIPSLTAFIRLCQNWGVAYDIAGPVAGACAQNIKQSLQTSFGIKEEQFIGGVSTEDFLAAHAADYLFVGGVGQVILEAGQLGFPCLMASLAGVEHSCFVTRGRFQTCYGYNFSPWMPAELEEVKTFCAAQSDDWRALRSGKTEQFDISGLVRRHAGLEEILKRYERLAAGKPLQEGF